MHSFFIAMNAVTPIVLCLALGRLLTYTPVFRDFSWASLEKAMFWVFLPALIFSSIVGGEFNFGESLRFATALVIAQSTVALIAFIHARIARLSAASMTSLFQNAARWNNIIPIALAATLYGDAGLNFVAIALAVMVPIANISCIVVMEIALTRTLPHADATSSWSKSAAVIKNPLVVACIAGMAVKAIDIALPPTLTGALKILSNATLGAGLLVVGAGISLPAMRRAWTTIALASALKVIAMPLLTLALCIAFGIDGLARVIAVLCAAAPTAMQGYIVARNMGGDAELMSSLITVEHITAAVSIPLMLWLAIWI